MAAIMPTQRTSSARGTELIPISADRTVVLPDIRTSESMINKNRPLPTSLQSDFIPEDILLAITQPPLGFDKLGPPSRYRNINTTDGHHRKVAANAWNYPGQRDKLKHLTKNIPCTCGAGRDISFLYDVPRKDERREKPSHYDNSVARIQDDEEDEPKKPLTLPDTLIPDEYHVVKNKGVMGLEYYEEKFATHPADHEKHLVQFPSMNPTSRYEVKQLKKTLNEMLEKAGIYEEEVEVKGPTQMHNLLELIKKEQNIYNIVFHELIRQTSVECLERGELLSDLRDKYSTILNKVPRQIRGLHEEVLAQRALDRRLTEELLRFKTTISALTFELANVKEHDVEVTRQASQAQDELKSALNESQKNAGLLAEYHALYELQRKRLEKQVDMLSDEKEIWSTVAYSLALKVMEEHSLNTAKRLHVSEKAWSKLAHHFTILLSDNDTVVLTSLQGYVDKWRDLVDEFNTSMCNRENDMRHEMKEICARLRYWAKNFEKHHLSKQGHLSTPLDLAKVTQLYNDVKSWEMTMAQESEKFGGDTVLNGHELMTNIRGQMYGWTDCAAKIFSRHLREDGGEHPDHADMIKMNDDIDQLLVQFNTRLTGENGVATGIIYINNSLESWDIRFNSQLHGNNPMPDHEWLRFYQSLEEWALALEDSMQYVGTTQKDEHRREMLPHREVTVAEIMKTTHKWVSSTVNGTDSEDAKLVEAVGNLHTEMVKWMVQMLLRLAPDQEAHSAEAKEAVLLGSATIGQLLANAKSLFNQLSAFTKYVTQCNKTIVLDAMQLKTDQRLENADVEYKALGRLGRECNEWVAVAQMMLTELTGEVYSDATVLGVMDLTDSKPSTADPVSREVSSHDKPQTQQTIAEESPRAGSTVQKEDDSANQQTEPDVLTVKQTDESANEQSGEAETANQESAASPAPANQEMAATEQGEEPQQEEDHGVKQLPDEPEDEEEVTPEQIEVIGDDANTHRHLLSQSPDVAPPAPIHPIRPSTTGGSTAGGAATPPDTKKAYEALAALDSLQIQLLATEERAQGAESKAATLEDQLKEADERIRALEREFGVKQEKPEEAPAVDPASSTVTATQKPEEKVEKPKLKSREKSSVSSRSSSRTSNKSVKKK